MTSLFDKSAITIYKANTVVLEMTIVDNATGEPIMFGNTDYVLFTVVNRYDETVIQKKLTIDDYDPERQVVMCTLTPEDTADLITGEYRYDCLYVYDGETPTTFASSVLVIKKTYGTVIGGDDDG